MDLGFEDVRELVRLCAQSELQLLRIEVGEVRLAIAKSDAALPYLFGAPGASAPRPAVDGQTGVEPPPPREGTTAEPVGAAALGSGEAGLVEVRAPSLGVCYRRPGPDQPSFVELGTEVGEDDTLCLIEVMKTYNRVRAGWRGRVAEICFEDAAMVEYGQALMRIRPS